MIDADNEKRLGRAGDVSRLLDVKPTRVYELANMGILPGVVRLGRQLRFDLVKIENFIEQGGQALPGGWRRESGDHADVGSISLMASPNPPAPGHEAAQRHPPARSKRPRAHRATEFGLEEEAIR